MRINEQITSRELRLIGPESEQLGIVSREEALQKARESKLDLCEIAPNARPPVVKLMDFGKFMYEKQKKAREARKKQKTFHVKEVKMTPMVSDHDFHIKVGKIIGFLSDGDKVKVTIMFRGRQKAHPEFGERVLKRVIEDTKTSAAVDKFPAYEGNQMTMVLSPLT